VKASGGFLLAGRRRLRGRQSIVDQRLLLCLMQGIAADGRRRRPRPADD